MIKKRFIWKEITIQFNRRTITGSYAEWKGMVIVKSPHGMKSLKSIGPTPTLLAKNILLELAAEKKSRKP
jgi:hypothetical protein